MVFRDRRRGDEYTVSDSTIKRRNVTTTADDFPTAAMSSDSMELHNATTEQTDSPMTAADGSSVVHTEYGNNDHNAPSTSQNENPDLDDSNSVKEHRNSDLEQLKQRNSYLEQRNSDLEQRNSDLEQLLIESEGRYKSEQGEVAELIKVEKRDGDGDGEKQ